MKKGKKPSTKSLIVEKKIKDYCTKNDVSLQEMLAIGHGLNQIGLEVPGLKDYCHEMGIGGKEFTNILNRMRRNLNDELMRRDLYDDDDGDDLHDDEDDDDLDDDGHYHHSSYNGRASMKAAWTPKKGSTLDGGDNLDGDDYSIYNGRASIKAAGTPKKHSKCGDGDLNEPLDGLCDGLSGLSAVGRGSMTSAKSPRKKIKACRPKIDDCLSAAGARSICATPRATPSRQYAILPNEMDVIDWMDSEQLIGVAHLSDEVKMLVESSAAVDRAANKAYALASKGGEEVLAYVCRLNGYQVSCDIGTEYFYSPQSSNIKPDFHFVLQGQVDIIKEVVEKEMSRRNHDIKKMERQARDHIDKIVHSKQEETKLAREDSDLDRDYERKKSVIARKIIDQKRHTEKLENERDSYSEQINAAIADKRITYGKAWGFWAVAKNGLTAMIECCKITYGDQQEEHARLKVAKHVGLVNTYNNGDWESHKRVIDSCCGVGKFKSV